MERTKTRKHLNTEGNMNTRQHALTVVMALIAGLVGGMVSSWFFIGQTVFAEKSAHEKVVRAEKFELVDSKGLKVADLIQGTGFVRFSMWQREGGTLTFAVNGTEAEISSRNPNTDKVFFIENSDSGPVMGMGDLLGEKIWFSFYKDEPYIELFDKNGRGRAVLGITELKNKKTGSKEIRAPSSLVLFNEKGNAVWSAP